MRLIVLLFTVNESSFVDKILDTFSGNVNNLFTIAQKEQKIT